MHRLLLSKLDPAPFALVASAWVLMSQRTLAQTEIFEFRDLQPTQCSLRVSPVEDFNSDGFSDVLLTGGNNTRIHSGFDGSVLRSLSTAGGIAVAIGDVDGDGVTDFLFGGISCGGLSCSETAVYSGATGARVYVVNLSGSFCPEGLMSSGDLSNDGIADFCLSGNDSGAGKVRAYSGGDGGFLWDASLPLSTGLSPVMDMLGVDVSGDVVQEIVVSGYQFGTAAPFVRLLSGSTGAMIWESSPGSYSPIATIGDVNGDGVPDIAARSSGSEVRLLSGLDGLLVRSFPSGTFQEIGAPGDVDLDGAGDVVLLDNGGRNPYGESTGAVRCHSGRTGALLWAVYGSEPGEGFGFSFTSMGDITSDGVPDMAVGSIAYSWNYHGGVARVLSGALLPNALTLPVGVGCSTTGFAPTLTASNPVVGGVFTTGLSRVF